MRRISHALLPALCLASIRFMYNVTLSSNNNRRSTSLEAVVIESLFLHHDRNANDKPGDEEDVMATTSSNSNTIIATTPSNTTASRTDWYACELSSLSSSSMNGNDNNAQLLPTVPHFIIAGAQKSGTTPLHHILMTHPRIEASRQKEPHFFDYRGNLTRSVARAQAMNSHELCDARTNYAKQWPIMNRKRTENNDVLTFDKTPAYMTQPNVPTLISKVCFWKPKIILILRNPVDRAYSQYKMHLSPNKPSFEEMLEQEVNQEWNNIYNSKYQYNFTQAPVFQRTIPASTWNTLPQSHFAIPSHVSPVRGKDEEDDGSQKRTNTAATTTTNNNRRDRRRVVSSSRPIHRDLSAKMFYRGLYAQQIANWMNNNFTVGGENNNLLILRYEQFQADKVGVLNEILSFIGLPPTARIMFDDSILNSNLDPVACPSCKQFSQGMVMKNSTRAYLERLYRPYNDELADLLGEEWRGVWGY